MKYKALIISILITLAICGVQQEKRYYADESYGENAQKEQKYYEGETYTTTETVHHPRGYHYDGNHYYEGDTRSGYTEVKTETYLDRVSNSFAAAFFGAILVFFGMPFLWFNERRAVRTR